MISARLNKLPKISPWLGLAIIALICRCAKNRWKDKCETGALMQMKGWESSEIFVWLLSLSFPLKTLFLFASPAQMLPGDLLGLSKWLELLQTEICFCPYGAWCLSFPVLGEKSNVSDSHFSLTCRRWSLSSAFRKVCGFVSNCCKWTSVGLSLLLCVFQGQSGRAAAPLKPPTQRDGGVMSCWIRVWEKQHLSPQCEKHWPANATAARRLTGTCLPQATKTFGSSIIYSMSNFIQKWGCSIK